MPRKGLKVTAEVCISAVSCPGVRLPLEHDVFLSICLLGHHVHTRSSPPIFPLIFKEKIKFIKTFACCSDVQQLDQALKEDAVVLELVRDDRICNKMVVLAIFETCAQNFLFPMQGLRPTYSCSDNEIILDPTNDFP
uniref:Spermatogenesis-associated protein 6 N-terminal domain-containing protein n=1 Tax=Strigamia maritima TaxID=126957 RepID=T1J5Q3_STRMM